LLYISSVVTVSFKDRSCKLWNTTSGECLQTFICHGDNEFALATARWISQDASSVLTSFRDHTVKLWSTTTGECLQTFTGHADRITTAVLSGAFVLTASDDHTAKIWDVMSGDCLQTLTGHEVWPAALSPDFTRCTLLFKEVESPLLSTASKKPRTE
jgi:WD40 repeat protein